MHCMTVSLAAGGVGLGTLWGEEIALSLLRKAGFPAVSVKQVEGDAIKNNYLARTA